MDRRSFLRLAAAGAAAPRIMTDCLAAGNAGNGKEGAVKPDEAIACCGLYCGTCARWHKYAAFRQAADMLAEIVDGHGFQHWMPEEVKEFDYEEFRKGLEFFRKDDTWLVCKKPCIDNDAMGHCRIRACCKERGLTTCLDCPEYPCEMTTHNPIFRAEEHRKLGKDKWCKLAAERASQGYELHTNKYYRVSVTKPAAAKDDE